MKRKEAKTKNFRFKFAQNLFYCYLEYGKVTSLKLNEGKLDAPAKINPDGKHGLEWWLGNTDSNEKSIVLPSVGLEYLQDFSSYSCGAHFDTHKIGGAWNMKEKALHITWKELLAVYHSMKNFNNYIKLMLPLKLTPMESMD